MYFKQIDEIISGAKTQTRRVCNPGEWLSGGPFEVDGKKLISPVAVYTGTIPHERLKWQVGRDYAVSPGRGRPAIHLCENQHGVMVPVEIDKVKMDNSTVWEEAKTDKFLATNKPDPINWLNNAGFYPLRILITEIRREKLQDISEADAMAEAVKSELMTGYGPSAQYSYVSSYRKLWNSINTRKGTHWEDNPEVWVLTFEVVRNV